MKSKLWFFSKDEDPHVRADEPADAKSVQPDHYPNVARPGGGYPEGRGKKTDAFCNKCDDQLVDGYCVRCDWGPQSVSEPIDNYPLNPFKDLKDGIRAASWKFGMPRPAKTPETWVEEWKKKGFTTTVENVEKGIREYKKKLEEKNKIRKNEGEKPITIFYGKSFVKGTCINGHSIQAELARPTCKTCNLISGEVWLDRLRQKKYEIANGEDDAEKIKLIEDAMNKHEGQRDAAKIEMICPNGHNPITLINNPKCRQCKNETATGRPPTYDPNQIITLNDLNLNLLKNKPAIQEIISNIFKNQGDIKLIDLVRILATLEDQNWLSRKDIADITNTSKRWIEGLLYSKKVIERALSPKQKVEKKRKKNWQKLIDEEGLLDALISLIEHNANPDNAEVGWFEYQDWLNKVDVPNNSKNRASLFKKIISLLSENELISNEDLDLLTKYKSQRKTPEEEEMSQRAEERYEWLLPQGKGGYKTGEPGYFYILESQKAFKIGISNDLEARMKQHQKSYADKPELQWRLREDYGPMEGIIPFITEKRLKNWLKKELNIDISVEGIEDGDGWTETAAITAVPVELVSFISQAILNNEGEVPDILENISDEWKELIRSLGPEAVTKLLKNEFGKELGIYTELKPVDPNAVRQQMAPLKSLPVVPADTQVPPTIKPNDISPKERAEQPAPSTPTAPAPSPFELAVTEREISQMLESGRAYQDAQGNIIDAKSGQPIQKKSDYQGWSNWDTWNTALYINNEQWSQEESRRIVYDGGSEQDLANWAIQKIIGPVNRNIMRDAQEWNDIPYDERPTGREDLTERMQEMAEGFDALFGFDPQSDEVPDLIEENKVNWNEIYNSIVEAIQGSEEIAHEDRQHDLSLRPEYAQFTGEELAEEAKVEFPWCPLCNPQNPDAPGDTTIPSDWTGF